MMPYVPEEQRDSRWHVWNDLFMVRVRFLDTMSKEYIQEFGVPAIGIASYDQSTANELVTRMMSVKDMVEYFGRGVTVALVNYNDAERVYNIISNHLQAWKMELERGFHTRNAPLDDLKLMDEFANAVYDKAKWQFTSDIVESILARRLNSVMRVTRQNILARPVKISTTRPIGDGPSDPNAPQAEPEPEAWKPPERLSMSEVFASRQIAGKPKWKL